MQQTADFITNDLLHLTSESNLSESLNFFIYDGIKIITLLIIINFTMAVVRYYLPVEEIRKILTSRNWYGLDYLLAALFGVFTPFCSCSSIPLFIGFVSSGVPLGVTFAFLITSPLVNEASLALFPALFGIKITIIYNLFGVVIGVVGGMIIHKLNMEIYIDPSLLNIKSAAVVNNHKSKKPTLGLAFLWWKDGWQITKSLIPYVLLGVGIGALIHGFIPANFFEKHLSSSDWWTVPLAAIAGIPLYANSVSVIPIVSALVDKGIALGTALAFMTAIVALSLPEFLILKKAMKLPLLLTFFGITTMGIVIMGYFLNFIS